MDLHFRFDHGQPVQGGSGAFSIGTAVDTATTFSQVSGVLWERVENWFWFVSNKITVFVAVTHQTEDSWRFYGHSSTRRTETETNKCGPRYAAYKPKSPNAKGGKHENKKKKREKRKKTEAVSKRRQEMLLCAKVNG